MAYVHFIPLGKADGVAIPMEVRAAVASQVGPGTYYPVGLTLAELFKLYWRFRGGEVELWESAQFVAALDLKILDKDWLTDEPESEVDMVCPKWTWQDPAAWVMMFEGEAPVYFYDDLYWPLILITTSESSSWDDPANGLSFNFEVAGLSIPVYYQVPAGSGTMKLVMSEEVYWEHDPGTGYGPVWDSSTGELLPGKNPFEVDVRA